MKEKKRFGFYATLAALVALLAFGIWGLPDPAAPSTETTDGWTADGAEERLHERFTAFRDARLRADWHVLYTMTDPRQRKVVDEISFLSFYGTGVLTTLSVELKEHTVDEANRSARSSVTTTAELNLSRMPAKYRQGLQKPSPEDLRKTMEHDVVWAWQEGDWYFQMEPEVLQQFETAQAQGF